MRLSTILADSWIRSLGCCLLTWLSFQSPTFAADALDTLTTASETDTDETVQSFTDGMLGELLSAEQALWRRAHREAYDIYFRHAQSTQAPEFAKRATQIAFMAIRNIPRSQKSELNTWIHAFKEAANYWFKLDPSADSAFLVVLETHLLTNDFSAIEPILKNALTLYPQLADGYWESITSSIQSLVYKGKMKPGQALTLVQSLATYFPQQAGARLAVATMARHAADLTLAKTEIEQAVRLKPDWDKPVVMKARLLLSEDNITEATDLLTQFIDTHPDSKLAQALLGEVYIASDQKDKAYAIFSKLSQTTPESAEYLQLAGELAAATGRYTEAETYIRQAIDTEADNADQLLLLLVQLSITQKKLDKLEPLINEIVDHKKRMLSVYLYTQALYQADRKADVRQFLLSQYQQASDKKERLEYIEIYTSMLRESGDYAQLSVFLNEALKKDPNEPQLLYDTALTEELLGRHDAAERLLRQLILQQPEYAHAYNALGYSLADRNIRLKEARQLLEKAAQLMPGDSYIEDSLGWLAFREGDYRKAIEILSRAYSATKNPEVAAHLGEVYWQMGKHDQAKTVWQEALEIDAEHTLLNKTIQRLNGAPLK